MGDLTTRFHALPDGRRIAYPPYARDRARRWCSCPATCPTWPAQGDRGVRLGARRSGRACLLLDYSGCGESEGDFADGTLIRWRDEVLALIEARCGGQVVLIGSSMGGWLMLLVALALPRAGRRRWSASPPRPTSPTGAIDAEQKATLAAGETVFEDNPYGPEPTPTHPRLLGRRAGQPPARRPRSRSTARCGCSTARPTPTCRGRSRCGLAAALRSPDVQVDAGQGRRPPPVARRATSRCCCAPSRALRLRTADVADRSLLAARPGSARAPAPGARSRRTGCACAWQARTDPTTAHRRRAASWLGEARGAEAQLSAAVPGHRLHPADCAGTRPSRLRRRARRRPTRRRRARLGDDGRQRRAGR